MDASIFIFICLMVCGHSVLAAEDNHFSEAPATATDQRALLGKRGSSAARENIVNAFVPHSAWRAAETRHDGTVDSSLPSALRWLRQNRGFTAKEQQRLHAYDCRDCNDDNRNSRGDGGFTQGFQLAHVHTPKEDSSIFRRVFHRGVGDDKTKEMTTLTHGIEYTNPYALEVSRHVLGPAQLVPQGTSVAPFPQLQSKTTGWHTGRLRRRMLKGRNSARSTRSAETTALTFDEEHKADGIAASFTGLSLLSRLLIAAVASIGFLIGFTLVEAPQQLRRLLGVVKQRRWQWGSEDF